MPKVRAALADAEQRLASIPGSPGQDAALLMAHALNLPVSDLKLHHLDDAAPLAFEALVARRLAREPVAYITGQAGFWSIELEIGPGVLIPRADSETLIEAAVAHFGGRTPDCILDLGTGPGTLLLAALDQWPDAEGIGVDADESALYFARRNAARLGIAGRARFKLGDWGAQLRRRFDLILCNPPYIPEDADLDPDVYEWEPFDALFGGGDGLDAYRSLAPQIELLLEPGGIACVELGDGQLYDVAHIFAGHDFTISSRKDLRGVERCLVLRR